MVLRIIRAADLNKYLDRRDVYLLDIRSKDEFARFHIEHAMHVSEQELDAFLQKRGKRAMYILCCQRGVTSVREGKRLCQAGYSVATLAGGVAAYQKLYAR